MSQPSDPAPSQGRNCSACGTPLHARSVQVARIGGTKGFLHSMLGGLDDLDEVVVDVQAVACPKCRRVEIRVVHDMEGALTKLFPDIDLL